MFIARSRASRAFRSCVLAATGLGLVLVPAALSSTAASAAQASGDPIVIGNVGTYSAPAQGGAGAEVAVGKDAIEAWAKWVNAHGGVNGHPVKLVLKDNKNDQAQAVAAVKELVEQDHVVAFVSNQDGSLNAGYADYLKEKGIPVLGGSVFTLDPWVSNPDVLPGGAHRDPGYHRDHRNDEEAGLQEHRFPRVRRSTAVRTRQHVDQEPLGKRRGSTTRTAAWSVRRRPTTRQTAWRPRVRTRSCWCCLIATADLGNKIADDCARQNYKPGWFIPGEAIGSGYLTEAFNNTYNAVGVQPWFSKDPSMKDFHAAMKKYAKGVNIDKADLPMNSVDAWASGLMFQKAVELSGATGVPTTADILAGLAKFNNETLGGVTGGLSYSDPENKNQYCYFTILIKKQKFTLPDGAKPSCVAKT